MKRCLISLMAGPLFLLAGCGEAPVESVQDVPRVRVLDLSQGSDNSYVEDGRLFFPAVAAAADRSRLSFRLSGEVVSLNVNEGDVVKKGQIIAELDPNDFKLEVDNTRASYSVADSQYKRSEQLVKKGLLAQSQFDELAAQRMIAKAEYDLARLRLSFTKLLAPADGIISRVNVEQFENVQVGQQIVNIHNPHEVDIVIQVADQLFANTPTDAEFRSVEADVKVGEGIIYPARLKEYTTEQDPSTATYNVTLTMPMPAEQLILDGMPVEVAQKNGRNSTIHSSAVTIPIEALFNPDGDALDTDNKFVWVLQDDNSVRKTRVITRRVSRESIYVTEGLAPDDTIVVAGISRLRDGMIVEPLQSGTASDISTQEAE